MLGTLPVLDDDIAQHPALRDVLGFMDVIGAPEARDALRAILDVEGVVAEFLTDSESRQQRQGNDPR
jgi:hypothetical protein